MQRPYLQMEKGKRIKKTTATDYKNWLLWSYLLCLYSSTNSCFSSVSSVMLFVAFVYEVRIDGYVISR